jgi:hypothetical protein
MSPSPAENYSLCELCGGTYINFCVRCAKAAREEVVEDLMAQYGMSVTELVAKLSKFVNCPEPNLQAIKIAIELMSMKPPIRTDVTSGGQPIQFDEDARTRLINKISRIVDGRTEK